MDSLLAGLAGLLGLAFGSFANVVIYRAPAGKSLVHPPSSCPRCDARIANRHNVPVVGWLWLRGKCASCKAPISPRYPIVEGLVAALFVAIVWHFGISWSTALLLIGAWVAVVLSAIDLDTRRLPRPIVVPWAVAVAVVVLASGVESGEWWPVARAAIGAASLGLFYAGAFFAYPKGMGWGDVTVAPVIGAVLGFLGWPVLVVGAFSAFVWGLAIAIGPMVKARAVKGVSIPFGPSMFVGAATGVVVGNLVGTFYLERILGL